MAMRRYLAEEVALDCVEGHLSRREALRRLALLGLTATSASALLAACSSGGDGAEAEGTATDGPAPTTEATSPPSSTGTDGTTAPSPAASEGGGAEAITFPGPNGELRGVWAEAASPKGAVLVIHENRGLTDHIASIPPRLAADGYSALALDLLSEEGGTGAVADEGQATALLGQAPDERLLADLRAGVDELERRAPGVGLGVVGFCFGGGMTWRLLAAGEPRLGAAVPFYGPAPADADFSGSRAAVLAIYAGEDGRVNATRDAVVAALDAAGLVHEERTFEGVDHAFFNDTGPRYDEAAAGQAYQAMLDWFGEHLSSPQ